MILIKTLQQILKKDLTCKTMSQTDYYLKDKIKKVVCLMKDELGGKISYLTGNNEDKKAKGTKNFLIIYTDN